MEFQMFDHKAVAIEQLIPYALNSRTHSDEQVAQLAASIREFGFTNPVLVDEENNLIAGHGRVMAARKLGLKEVPAVIVTGLDDRKRRALIIADNKLALNAGWDEQALRVELEDLAADFGGLMGFSEDELAALLAEAAETEEGLTDEDAVPELAEEPVTKLGDVWLLGKHRLMCGDSTSIDAVDKLMDGKKADMVFTDPPYNADYSSRVDKSRRKPWGGILNDNMSTEAFDEFLIDLNSVLWQTVVDGACVYECIDWKRYPQLSKTFAEAFEQKAMIVWNKNYFGLGTYYRTKHEIILFGVKGKKLNTWNAGHNEMDVWDLDREKVSNYQHPTQKPVTIPERAINNSSNANELILDLFGGSGSTLIACEKTNRQARLMELDPKYCDVIVKRWQDFTGKKATLEATGQTFDQVCEPLDAQEA
jgi:DNA modification methylase